MGLELLLALGIPILLLVCGTLYFAARGQFPQVLNEVVWFFWTGPIVNLDAGHRP